MFFRSIIERLVSIIILLLLSPVFLLISLVILITMGRPIFFVQKRMGRNNTVFKMYKFRTMKNTPIAKTITYASIDDPRITKFGQILRKHRIDELPQFLNIVFGNMSLIGPRPEPMSLAEGYSQSIKDYSLRHLVNPGITGYAQVKMGYADSEQSTKIKLSYDLEYVKKISFKLDMKIILDTIKVVLTGFGAR